MLQKVEKLNEAEQALITLAEAGTPSPLKRKAIAALREHGLPTRRVEAWHYTDLRNRLAVPGPVPQEEAPAVSGLVDGPAILIRNGRLADSSADLPGTLEEASPPAPGFQDATDAVALVNALTGGTGVRLRLDDNVTAARPVTLLHWTGGGAVAACRHNVELAPGTTATIVERHLGGADAVSNVVTDLAVGEGASAIWTIDQELDSSGTHLSQLNVTLDARARLVIYILNAGGGLVRQEVNLLARGQDASIEIRGVNLIGGEAHIDVTTVLRHEAPHVYASELFRNVATGQGRGIFQGLISVAQQAQKTDARMACNTLLLSDDAEFSAKPELEIFADDVQCGHGATVADIVDDHLFYLRSRGIGEREARAMLVTAFVEEAFEGLEDETLREALNSRIEDWLDDHA